MTATTRHEYFNDTDEDDAGCNEPGCGQDPDDAIHSDPADDLPQDVLVALEAAAEAVDLLAQAIRKHGARDSSITPIRRFAAYHLADLEGNDGGSGWLGDRFLADEMRALLNGDRESR